MEPGLKALHEGEAQAAKEALEREAKNFPNGRPGEIPAKIMDQVDKGLAKTAEQAEQDRLERERSRRQQHTI
jgi:D-alanine-D-alanine ligase-like ATP-grasp enzyme